MSYTDKVKDELLRRSPKSDCCGRAKALGFLRFSRIADNSRHIYRTASEALAKYATAALASQLGMTADCIAPARADREKPRYTVSIPYSGELDRFSGAQPELVCERCAGSYIAGAFLASGYAADPEKSMRAEIACPDEEGLLFLERLLSDNGIVCGRTVRREVHSVIIKGKQSLEDFYAMTGATTASMKVIEAAVDREHTVRVTRSVNREIANINKAAIASTEQRRIIKRYLKAHELSSLPPELREIAELRLNNPDMALTELCELSSDRLTKSGMYHRMRKLMDYCEGRL